VLISFSKKDIEKLKVARSLRDAETVELEPLSELQEGAAFDS
jgi:hypothetical protein